MLPQHALVLVLHVSQQRRSQEPAALYSEQLGRAQVRFPDDHRHIEDDVRHRCEIEELGVAVPGFAELLVRLFQLSLLRPQLLLVHAEVFGNRLRSPVLLFQALQLGHEV